VTRILPILIVLACSVAHAHDWYEPACCGGSHCHPVADGVVVEGAAGVTVEGFGLMSYSDWRLRWSRDERDHVCIVDGKLACVYRRPKGM